MSVDQNKSLLRRFIDLWNTGKLQEADEFVQRDLIDHSLPPGMPTGLAGFKLLVETLRAAFPDLQITIDEIAATQDKATARVTFHGTHRGTFQGLPATGNSFSMGAIGILRIANDMVVEHWAVLDVLGMLQQLGAAPAMSDLPYSVRWPTTGIAPQSSAAPAQNEAIVRRFFAEVCNARELGNAEALFASNHRYYDPSIPGVQNGADGIIQPNGPVIPYQTAFSDAHWHVEDLIAVDDIVVTHWYGTGTHDSDMPGIPAAGAQVNVPGIWWQRLAQGKVVESWQVWDTLVMLQQLGVVPAPAEVA